MKRIVSLVLAMVLVFACLALTACGGNAKQVKVIDIALTNEEYAFGVDKNQPELLEKVNAFIVEIKSNGKLDEICAKYFQDGTPEGVTSAAEDASKDQLVVATNAQFEPFEYKKGDTYYGVDMEIAKLLAAYLGKELVIKNMDFDAVCLSVSQGKADIAMAGLTVKEDRKEFVTFSESYYNASQMLVVNADDTRFDECKTVADVEAVLKTFGKDVKAGCQTGTTAQFYLEGDADWEFEGYNVTTIGYKAGSLAIQDMMNGNISFVIIDEAPAKCIVKAMNG
jgi:polar amino acid transport system substrate-binding protein